ncbi:MAG: hypothetical protein LBD61_04930 [Endomicrobium sp.]|jgi:ribosomal protein L31|nr:hypothetical protein [Endomicrobium sp.]
MKLLYSLILVSAFTCFGICAKAQAYNSSLEKLIGIRGLEGAEELLTDPSYYNGIFDKYELLYNAAMAAKAAYFSKHNMVTEPSEIPTLLGANKYKTIIAPNSWLFGLYTSSYEEKGLAYTTEINGEETLVLSFRGTSNFNESVSDANFFGKRVTIGKLTLDVHAGIYNIFRDIENQIHDLIENFMTKGTVKRILITGHSLGGGIASIVAPYVKQSSNLPVDLITFEAPKVFSKDSADTVKKSLGSNSIIIIADEKDIVTKVGYGGWTGGDLGKAQTDWSIIDGNSILSYHSIDRVVGNLALQGRLMIEKRLDKLKTSAELKRDFAIRTLNRENDVLRSIDEGLIVLENKLATAKNNLAFLTDQNKVIDTQRKVDELQNKYQQLENRRNRVYARFEQDQIDAEHRIDLINTKKKELTAIDIDELFISKTSEKGQEDSWFKALFKSILSNIDSSVEDLLQYK